MAGELGKVRAVSLWAVSIHYIIYVDVDAGSPFRGGEEPEKRKMYMAGKHFWLSEGGAGGSSGGPSGEKRLWKRYQKEKCKIPGEKYKT
jgi:hypothetical protein